MAILAFDGVVLADLATPLELFGRVRDADGRCRYEVRVVSEHAEVDAGHVSLTVPWRLAWTARADTVVVPGIDTLERPLSAAVLKSLQRAASRGTRIASICSGAFVLAAAGVLDGLRATTHWAAAAELARRHPGITVDPDVLYIDNGNILTSAGAAAALDLCLYIVRRDFGARTAADAARAAVMPLERAGGQAQFIVHTPPADAESLAAVLAWMERNLERPLDLPAIARKAAMSTRTLSRRFREQTGTTPARWVAAARVRKAQRLLETTELDVETVAERAGFGSAAVLRERFAAALGTAPLAYRRAFRRSVTG